MCVPIENINVYCGKMPTDLHFSYGDVHYFPFAIVEVISGEYVGWGEGLVGQDDWSMLRDVSSQLIGKDASRLDAILPEYLNAKRYNIVREAFSMGLWTLISAYYNVPLCVLLGGKKRDYVPLMPCIFAQTTDEAAEIARKFVSEGYENLKVKFFGKADKDIAILQAMRESIGRDVYIQADVNRGYKSDDDFLKVLAEFDRLGLDVIEDPISGGLEDYRKLREKTGVKIMIDAGARTIKDVADVLKAGAADFINQHPCQQGGIERALQISHSAEMFGVPTMVGGTGFLGIGSAVYQMLASVIGLNFPCGELGGYIDHKFEYSIIKNPLPINEGKVKIPKSAGLSVQVDKELLIDNCSLLIEGGEVQITN